MDWLARNGRGYWLTTAFVVCWLFVAEPAPAVDTLYWADQNSDTIQYVPADGSAPSQTLYPTENDPDGIALDPSTGRIYWASEGVDAVRTGLLSGAGPAADLYTGEDDLDGLAVDPVNNRIYWVAGATVRGAPLAGGGTVDTLHSGDQGAQGVAADVAGNLLYWTQNSFEFGFVRRGPFGGGGAASLYGPGEYGPSFVAVDSAADGVWWTLSCCDGGVRKGTPGGAAATTVYPDDLGEGIVADTAGGRLYWVESNDGPSEIHSAPIAGGGTVNTVVDTSNRAHGRGLALLRTPLNTAAPVVSPTSGPSGTVLSCTQGTWSIGVPGAFVYRAPTSYAYQWQRDGADINGATSASYTAPSPGTYTCRVTATNQAGSTPANSNEAVIADPAPPVVALSPDEHDFGERPVDDDSPPQQTFTAHNSGGSTANITSLALAGPEAEAFGVVSNACGATLAAGASCDVVVSFDPDDAGAKIAMLELKSDGGNDSSSVAGTGVAPAPTPRPPAPAPNPPASLNLLVANNVVLHQPVVPTRCRSGRRVQLRRCRVSMFSLGGQALGAGTQGAGSSQRRAKRNLGVRIRVNRRGRSRVAPALGGVPVKLRAVGRMGDGRRRRDQNRTRLFAERHHLVPPISGIFVADKPILLPAGHRFLRYIAARARRVDVVQCHGHAARLPNQFVNPVFAASLAVERAFVACNYLRRHGMRAKFVKIGHSNTISRNPGSNRNNPATWPPDRRSGIVLIRH